MQCFLTHQTIKNGISGNQMETHRRTAPYGILRQGSYTTSRARTRVTGSSVRRTQVPLASLAWLTGSNYPSDFCLFLSMSIFGLCLFLFSPLCVCVSLSLSLSLSLSRSGSPYLLFCFCFPLSVCLSLSFSLSLSLSLYLYLW